MPCAEDNREVVSLYPGPRVKERGHPRSGNPHTLGLFLYIQGRGASGQSGKGFPMVAVGAGSRQRVRRTPSVYLHQTAESGASELS